jgi:protein-S-isoprenylcysteine O-methyltransferase Ste14
VRIEGGVSLRGLLKSHASNWLLLGTTLVELWLLHRLTPTFTLTDWIYVSMNVIVLVIALVRRPARMRDDSLAAGAAVFVSYTYSYAQVAILGRFPGHEGWPAIGLTVVLVGASLSLTSLLSLGKYFGIRPALRGVTDRGLYRLVRHPLYLSYMIADIGYNLQAWSPATLALVAAGWTSLVYRIHVEERVLSHDEAWRDYTGRVRYRLVPGVW